jgi:hypothetical protein
VRVPIWFHLWKNGFRVELLKRFRQLVQQEAVELSLWVYQSLVTGET